MVSLAEVQNYLENKKQQAISWYNELNQQAKILFWIWVALQSAALIATIILTPAWIFEQVASWADIIRDAQYGWLFLLVVTIITSFPPMMGYGTCITLCGFAFGVWYGWLLAVAGCLLGGVCTFLVTRHLIEYFAPMLAHQTNFKALSKAVDSKGLTLVVLIRFAPFPYPYSNLFFASIPSVTLWDFFLATLTITPKLLLHVWIGNRTYLFADPDSRNQMDSGAKFINGLSIAVGLIVGVGVSWYTYVLTKQYMADDDGIDLEANYDVIGDVDAMLDNHPLRSDEEQEEEEEEEEEERQSETNQQIPYYDNEAPRRDELSDSEHSDGQWDQAFDFDAEDYDASNTPNSNTVKEADLLGLERTPTPLKKSRID